MSVEVPQIVRFNEYDEDEYEYYYEEEEEKQTVDEYEYYYEEQEYNVPVPPPPAVFTSSLLRNIDSDLNKPLPLPYDGCLSRIKYGFQSFLVTHGRIYALYLLFEQTWPRALVLIDMYTDFLVAYALYKGNEKIWFMLSSLFIVLPFVLVWSVSLRFIQLYIQKLFDRLTTKQSKKLPYVQVIISCTLMIYMFPPVGAILMATAEVFWVIQDIIRGIKAFVIGNGLIDTENREIKAMKSYRRAVEVFAESVPQTLLQLYIFIRLSILENDSNTAAETVTVQYQGVEINALTISFGVSILNLFYNFYKFKSEAQIHGMSWAEYALSVLQLAEVPIIKLVPRAPAIKKGYIEQVNFGGFRFDKESLTPLLEAINSTKCRLKAIKMSIGSLSKLDIQSCQLLGNLLNNTGIKVLISSSLSLLDLKNLFQSLDTNNNGYLEEDDFLQAIKALNCSIENATTLQKQRIFKKLAIRRLNERDRVYFYDFFKTSASVEDNVGNIDFDLTQIEYPLHYIFQRIQQIVEKDRDVSNIKEEQNIINSLNNLYHFCDGLCILNQFDFNINNHVFYVIIDVLCVLGSKKSVYPKYTRFVSELFDRLLNSNVFDDRFYLHRNNVFESAKHEQKLKLLNASDLATKLQKLGFDGVNILEYCFMYKPEYRDNQCKIFTRLFNVWLNKTDKDTIKEEIIQPNGELFNLLNATNGFHIKDNDGKTVLYYSVKYGLNNVIECFATIVIPYLIERGNCEWLQNQLYLNTILHDLLKTEAKTPSSDSLKLLLSTNVFNLEYTDSQGKHLADHILIYRFTAQTQSRKEYLLKCFQILADFNYNFAESVDLKGNNVLHYVSYLDDVDAAIFILDKCRLKSNNCVNKILNAKNKQNRTALSKAFLSNSISMTKLLIIQQQQEVDYNEFIKKLKMNSNTEWKHIRNEWVLCLRKLFVQNNGILNKINKNIKENIYIEISQIKRVETQQLEHVKRRQQKSQKNDKKIKELIHALTVIQGKLEKYIDKRYLPSTCTEYHGYSHIHTNADSVLKHFSAEQSKPNEISYKIWYRKSIKDTRDNSCISIKNISPKDAAISWLSVNLITSIMQSLIWISAIYFMHNNWEYPFQIDLISDEINIYYICFILWIIIVISDILGLIGIIYCIRWCIIIKLFIFSFQMLLTDFPIALAFYDTNRTPARVILIAGFCLNFLYTIFAFYDIYKIFKWIKHYQNGGIYPRQDMEFEKIKSRTYKIVNLNQRLNGEFCKVVLILDPNTYRITLVNDIWRIGPRIIKIQNLEIAIDNSNDEYDDDEYLYSKKKRMKKKSKKLSLHETDIDHSDDDDDEKENYLPQKPYSLLQLKNHINHQLIKERVNTIETVHDHIIMGNANANNSKGWLIPYDI